jgi:hypothetical protein
VPRQEMQEEPDAEGRQYEGSQHGQYKESKL